jgi:hypothetical protein
LPQSPPVPADVGGFLRWHGPPGGCVDLRPRSLASARSERKNVGA